MGTPTKGVAPFGTPFGTWQERLKRVEDATVGPARGWLRRAASEDTEEDAELRAALADAQEAQERLAAALAHLGVVLGERGLA